MASLYQELNAIATKIKEDKLKASKILAQKYFNEVKDVITNQANKGFFEAWFTNTNFSNKDFLNEVIRLAKEQQLKAYYHNHQLSISWN